MKKRTVHKAGSVLALISLCFLAPQPASAISLSASAELDWANIVFEFTGGSLIAPSNEFTSTSVDQPSSFLFDSDSNSDNVTLTESHIELVIPGVVNFNETATGSAMLLSATTNFVSIQPVSAIDGATASSSVFRHSTWTTSGAGQLTIKVPYALSATTDAAGLFAQAWANIDVIRTRSARSTYHTSSQASIVADLSFDAAPIDAGDLLILLPFMNGDVIDIYASANNFSFADAPPVPLPSSLALLGSAFLPLLRRRFVKRG